jgi:hypothetical protein
VSKRWLRIIQRRSQKSRMTWNTLSIIGVYNRILAARAAGYVIDFKVGQSFDEAQGQSRSVGFFRVLGEGHRTYLARTFRLPLHCSEGEGTDRPAAPCASEHVT